MSTSRQNLLFEKKKILVVDDEPDILELICFNLESEGFLPKTASDGEKCLEIIEAFNPDVVLLDIMMPKVNGIEVCRRIRANPKYSNLSIIFLSALNDESTQIRALEEGGDEYITKPVSPKLLLAIVKAQIRKSVNLVSGDENKNNRWANPIIVYPIFSSRKFKEQNRSCFILMPFEMEWSDRVYKKMTKILKKEKFTAVRADNIYGHNILEDIWCAINEATCIIADITNRNPNVFYEIGIAHTLGKDVILLTQNSEDIPFDFKHFRHIIYEDNVDGFLKLEKEIPNFLKYFTVYNYS